ncbi:MAG: hypothetical protein L0Y58_11920 [Verrucomicrobia subdivision 3 bacterium]|nr:hypothetical protein [Limisphaerales bacterium]
MARWHSLNVLQSESDLQNLWQFSAGGKFALQKEESRLQNEPLPDKIIDKDWQTLFQPKLNIAWLPAEKVFLRVVHLPKIDFAETQSMVELQLEKLSPLPVAQIVWGFELLPHVEPGMQTVVVIIAARHYVEEFLGQLEGRGYLVDRLEIPFLDQLLATPIDEDGVWIYAGVGEDQHACLVAWWYRKTLWNLNIIHLPATERRAALLQEQLAQMTWAGELEGWLTSPPRYYLVADDAAAGAWIPMFPPEIHVEIIPPIAGKDLAVLTAKRAAAGDTQTNLLPPEFTARYKQRFVDRLWMRGLGAIIGLYIMFVALYLGWAQFAKWRFSSVEDKVAEIGPTYTNTVQLKERVRVLQDQLDLQYAALDCWKATADNIPPELTLDNLNFERGRTLRLFGTASQEDVTKVQEFNDAIRNVTAKNQPLFTRTVAPTIQNRPGGNMISWNFSCELKRGESE